jgi:hypothetical protein
MIFIGLCAAIDIRLLRNVEKIEKYLTLLELSIIYFHYENY